MEESAELLVARTLAKQFAKDFETECAPFQCAPSTRAGTDCVGHMRRAATDSDEAATVLSVDGIGAYDHISRSAMLEGLSRLAKSTAHSPIRAPLVWSPVNVQLVGSEWRQTCSELSIGIQGALEAVAGTLEAGGQLCAFLDAPQSEDGSTTSWRGAFSGWQAFTFTRAKQECGTKPASHQKMSTFGAPRRGSLCWEPLSGALSSSPESCKQGLRRSVGCGRRSPQCPICNVGGKSSSRAPTRERTTHCASSHPFLPPSMDVSMMKACGTQQWHCWGNFQGQQKTSLQREVSHLFSCGWEGWGCVRRHRGGDAAYWASRADALEMISKRNPVVADKVVAVMVQEAPPVEECLAELRAASKKLDREGFWWRPTWQDLREGLRPPETAEVGDHGVMVGNIGLFPFPFLSPGRRSCCTTRQLLVGLTFAPTLDTTLV